MTSPFTFTSGSFGLWVAGYAALWGVLLLMVEGGGGDLAVALSVLIAGGMTVLAADNIRKNFQEVQRGS